MLTREALPSGHGLDIGAFSRLFTDTTNSYKHLLFNALLDALQERGFAPGSLRLDSLAIGMLAIAWHPAKVFRLSLGVRDQAVAVLDGIDLVPLHRGFDRLSVSRIEYGQIGVVHLDSDAPSRAGLA